jgi:CubicO group peptidase (beta-lactamase class C family)
MTIFHLLTHTAGFQGLATPPATRRGLKSADGTVAGFVKAAMDGSLDAQPGETFNYTNSGYFILGHLIQKISGQSYERFIEDNIFTPLQMKETTLEKGAENPNTAAGFRSTTADLLRWQLALYGGKVLSAASLQRMTTSFKGDRERVRNAPRACGRARARGSAGGSGVRHPIRRRSRRLAARKLALGSN